MSCISGYNKDLFLEQLAGMSAVLKGKRLFRMSYDSMEHNVRLNWLRKNAQLTDLTESMEVSPDGSIITLSVLLDDVTF